jgi:hypothetical protein
MTKLEEAGLVRRELNGYVVDRIVLRNLIRFRRVLIPRNFFYTVFFMTSLVFLVTLLRPPILTREYIFSLAVVSVAVTTSAYDTIKALSEKVL